MPCATIHLVLAGRVLDAWDSRPDRAPVDIARPGVRRAFVHGSLAPDMGFVPGTDRLVSEVAHYLQPTDLTRELLRTASTEEERAFAWGWATHVLGDVEIHPLVGRAVGERLYGDRERRVDALEDVATHVSTEVGLDIAVLMAVPEVPSPPSVPHFDGRSIRHLEAALARTYCFSWDRAALLSHHRRAVQMTRWWPLALRTLGRGGSGGDGAGARSGRLLAGGLWAVRRLIGTGTPAAGFFSARIPPRWVLRDVHARFEGFPDRFQEWVDDDLSGVPNRNLETGGEAGPGLGHPASDAVAGKVRSLQVPSAERQP